MNTELTIEEIELLIISLDKFNIRKNIVVPNVSWGFLNHEADILVLSKSGYLTEIEIKRSLSDLKADFKKKHDHSDERIKSFFYCVPESLFQQTIDLCILNERSINGVITYTDDNKIKINYYPLYYGKRSTGRKLFLEEQLQIARLGSMRVWRMQDKYVKSIQK